MSLIVPKSLTENANLQAFTTTFTLPTVDGSAGQALTTDGAGNLVFGAAGGGGTVTSVGLTAPTGFSVAGSPVTSTGTLALSFDAGYSLPTDASQTNWNTAYGWGDHATAGYLTSLGSVGGHTDVDTTSTPPTDKQVLQYQSGTGLWIPADGGITNGTIINGTAFFVTDTKPTTRIDGSALVAGDRWTKPSDGTEWFWNGTYWLSSQYFSQTIFRDVSASNDVAVPLTVTEYSFSPVLNKLYFLEDFTYRVGFNAATDENNYWSLYPRLFRTDGISQGLSAALGVDTNTPIFGTSPQSGTVTAGFTFVPARTSACYVSFKAEFKKVGSPGNLQRPVVNYRWREVA